MRLILSISIFCLFLSGCGLTKISEQADIINAASEITGKINAKHSNDDPVFVILYKIQDGNLIPTDQIPLNPDKSFTFYATKGKFMLFAFADKNGNLEFDANEQGNYLSQNRVSPFIFRVAPNRELILPDFKTTLDHSISMDDYKVSSEKRFTDELGKIVSLQSSQFDLQNAQIGLWRPLEFLETVGAGFYFLEEYDPNKTPILFIHGISGSPRQFEEMIDRMDKEKYQAWVTYYPSGVRLEMISNAILSGLAELYSKYQFQELNVIAHSMGGLVSRSLLQRHEETETTYKVTKYMAINSPLLGMASAQDGIEYSPIVIPVWNDLSPQSKFVTSVNQWKLPEQTEYSLIFSYLENETGDGVVPVSSQLSMALQQQADHFIGFKAEHSKILNEPDFLSYFAEQF